MPLVRDDDGVLRPGDEHVALRVWVDGEAMRIGLWFYFVAALHGLAQGAMPTIRQIGPFPDKATCEEARRAENPTLWRSDECLSDDMDAPTYTQPRL